MTRDNDNASELVGQGVGPSSQTEVGVRADGFQDITTIYTTCPKCGDKPTFEPGTDVFIMCPCGWVHPEFKPWNGVSHTE
jgi:hypothetical protein